MNESELSKIDSRADGKVEVIDVKLNNRKTKKIGEIKNQNFKDIKIEKTSSKNITENKTLIKNSLSKIDQPNLIKNNARFKMPDRRKVIFKKHKLETIKYISTHWRIR